MVMSPSPQWRSGEVFASHTDIPWFKTRSIKEYFFTKKLRNFLYVDKKLPLHLSDENDPTKMEKNY